MFGLVFGLVCFLAVQNLFYMEWRRNTKLGKIKVSFLNLCRRSNDSSYIKKIITLIEIKRKNCLNNAKSLAMLAVFMYWESKNSLAFFKVKDGGLYCLNTRNQWLLSFNGLFVSICSDIDECTEPGHGCSQLCNNTMGGYNCYCLKGYWLRKDNKTCIGMYSDHKF